MVSIAELSTPLNTTVTGGIPPATDKDVVEFLLDYSISAVPSPSMDILPLVEAAKDFEIECTAERQ